MSFVGIRFFILALLLATVACSDVKDELDVFRDDIDFEANDRTADIELEVMEPMAAGIVEGIIRALGHSPVFDILDANALQSMQSGTCVTGAVTGAFPRLPGENYSHGDTAYVEYQDCVTAEGYVLSGRVDLGYGPIQGLNRSFNKIDTDRCIAQIEDLEGRGYSLVENELDGEYFYADAVRFVERGGSLDAEWLLLVEDEELGTSTFELLSRVSLEANTIVVLRALVVDEARSSVETTYYSLAPGGYPSLDGGDMVYYVNDSSWDEADCQQYERTVAANVQDLTLELDAEYAVALDGRVTLYQATEDQSAYLESFVNSDFVMTTTVLNRTNEFVFRDFTAELIRNDETRGFSLDLSGQVASTALEGVIDLATQTVLQGFYTQYQVTAGKLRVSGREDEKMDITFSGSSIKLEADTDGDTIEGNFLLDIEATINTFWQDLVNGYFEYTD